MKAGTTTLAALLREHPQVGMAARKEVHFFDSEENWRRGEGWYRGQFAGAAGEVVGEATPNYAAYPQAVERMAQVVPEARVIVCIREPVARAYSHWRQTYLRQVTEDRRFPRAIAEELARAGPPRIGDGHHHYLAKGRYAEHLREVEARFGRERIHVVLLDDLDRAPLESFRRVCRFLGVDDAFIPSRLGEHVNPHREFHPVWLHRAFVRHHVWDHLPQPVRSTALVRVMRRTPAAPDLPPQTRRALEAHYEGPNGELESWLGRRLPWPRAAAPVPA